MQYRVSIGVHNDSSTGQLSAVRAQLHAQRKKCPMPSIAIPAEALIFNAHGTQVAVVKNGAVQLQPVHILHDLGTTLDIDRGLKADETVVLSPYAELASGQRVKPIDAALASSRSVDRLHRG